MNCTEFLSSLDAGVRAHNAHSQSCTSCTRALQSAIELDRLLAIPVTPHVTREFNDAVLQRIHNRRFLMTLFAEPLVPVAMTLLVIVLWQFRAISTLVMSLTHDMLMVALLGIAIVVLAMPLFLLQTSSLDR